MGFLIIAFLFPYPGHKEDITWPVLRFGRPCYPICAGWVYLGIEKCILIFIVRPGNETTPGTSSSVTRRRTYSLHLWPHSNCSCGNILDNNRRGWAITVRFKCLTRATFCLYFFNIIYYNFYICMPLVKTQISKLRSCHRFGRLFSKHFSVDKNPICLLNWMSLVFV